LAKDVCTARNGTYRSLDEPGWRQVAKDDPVALLRGSPPVVIDEFQLGGNELLRAVKVVAIEVKAASVVAGGDVEGLRRVAARLTPTPVHCALLYLGNDVLPFGPGFTAFPLSALWAAAPGS